MTKTELTFLTIAEAAKLIQTRAISPVELTQAILRRVEALDEQINAFNTVVPELALKQARDAETEIVKGHYRGYMHGIPFGVKDIYDTAGILTSGYSRTLLNNVPESDATAVAKLFANGAVLIGKLATHELAIGEYMAHYHDERNHQGLGNSLIRAVAQRAVKTALIQRRPRLGGMLNYYYRAAA